ncbi:MAG: molybdopterin-dependent oxidoreductase [Alphaproteobacteria bacterium]|nr:molybdopterin-dependent oxidoreductase [Alphaproteobacteria bacterium]
MRAIRRRVLLALLLALAAAAPAAGESSAALSVGGLVKSPRSFTLAELQALPWTTREAAVATARGPGHATWLGVALWTLLDQSGGVAVPAAEFARHNVIVTGRDGHAVTLSLAAVAPGGGAHALVAWSRDGRPFDPRRGLRLVVPGDPRNRDVRDVVEIEVN